MLRKAGTLRTSLWGAGWSPEINETDCELTQLLIMVFYDTCQFFLQVNSGFFGWTLLKCLCSALISIQSIQNI